MNTLYKNKLPKWYTSEVTQYDIILSDDIDSLASCMVIKQAKDWNIEYFYTFDGMGETKNAKNEKVGVDIALCNGKTFDNHVVMFTREDDFNEESINLNVAERINRGRYSNKYCGSTLLTVWSLFDLPLPESEEGKMILLAIDSTYKGFYSTSSEFNKANKYYLCNVLELDELYECQKRHKAYEFMDIKKKYNLMDKITHLKGVLDTTIKLEEVSKEIGLKLILPTSTFYKYGLYETHEDVLQSNTRWSMNITDLPEVPFSLALTKCDKVKYSCQI